jgi:hypothetical protein
MEQSTFGVDHLRDSDNGFMEPERERKNNSSRSTLERDSNQV